MIYRLLHGYANNIGSHVSLQMHIAVIYCVHSGFLQLLRLLFPSESKTLKQCWFDTGPASTLNQHWFNFVVFTGLSHGRY